MRFFLPILFILLIISPFTFAQSVHLGLSGTLSTSISESNTETEIVDHRNVGIAGLDFRYKFQNNLPISVGLQARYGERTLLDRGPVFGDGTANPTGLNRELKIFLMEIPFLYHRPLSQTWALNGGLQSGFAYLKVNELATFHDSGDGAPVARATGSGSGTSFSLTPVLQLTHQLSAPAFLTFGAEYRLLQFDVTWIKDFEFAEVLNPLLSGSTGTFDLDGFFFNVGLHFKLWESDD